MLTQRNWAPIVYRRLNEVIQKHKTNPAKPKSKRPYVVFDFDDTTIIRNVQKGVMIYMMETLSYKLTPEEFSEILNSIQPTDSNAEWLPNTTAADLIADILSEYEWLYRHYINSSSRTLTIEEARQTQAFHNFRAKLYYFHTQASKRYSRLAGQPWVTYWFVNYDTKEFEDYCFQAFDWLTKQPFELYTFQSDDSGRAGKVTVNYTSGLTFPEETKELYDVLVEQGFEIYVISASPVDIVRAAVKYGGYPVPPENIYAIQYEYTPDGRITNKLDAKFIVSKNEGKTEIIQKHIQPNHEGIAPVMVFGDSMGDFDMMVNLEGVELSVLFNRVFDDQTQDIIRESVASNKRFVVQGRNELTGQLNPGAETVSIKTQQTSLYYENRR